MFCNQLCGLEASRGRSHSLPPPTSFKMRLRPRLKRQLPEVNPFRKRHESWMTRRTGPTPGLHKYQRPWRLRLQASPHQVKRLPYPLIPGAAQVPEIMFLGWASGAREMPDGQTSSFCGPEPGTPSFCSSGPTSCGTPPFSASSSLVLSSAWA